MVVLLARMTYHCGLGSLGHVSAANVSQIPWHGNQGMYGMLESFMGGSGVNL